MKHLSTLILGAVVVVVLLGWMITFTVRFNEVYVVTTFGKPSAVYNGGEGTGPGPGMYFKWPWPIQDYRRFDKRMQILETKFEQAQTKDGYSVVARIAMVWHVGDAEQFSNRYRSEKEAEQQLENQLRSENRLGSYNFEELAGLEEGGHKNQTDAVGAAIKDAVAKAVKSSGIEIVSVTISRLEFPKEVTTLVYKMMKSTRERMAQNARSSGQAEAEQLKGKARGDRDRILAHANHRAQLIRSQADEEVAKLYGTYRVNEDLAIFLKQLETLEKTLQHNTTFVLDAETPPFELLKNGPKNAAEKKGGN